MSGESIIYRSIGEMHGFLEKFDYFSTDDNTKYLVLSLIDHDLMDVMDDQVDPKLDLMSTLSIGIQTVSIYYYFVSMENAFVNSLYNNVD